MIVDVHTHFFRTDLDFGPRFFADIARCGIDPGPWRDLREKHLETTKAAEVAIVFGLQGAATGWMVSNDAVAEHTRLAPERLIFFTSPDPGQKNYREELERTHCALGARGVKLAPIYQGVHP